MQSDVCQILIQLKSDLESRSPTCERRKYPLLLLLLSLPLKTSYGT